MLNEHDSHHLLNNCIETSTLQSDFAIVAGTGAKFGADGDQYYYGVGELPEPTGIYGFGKTPREALQNFSRAYWSQTIKPK
jgi:hypothetical protein